MLASISLLLSSDGIIIFLVILIFFLAKNPRKLL
jgi:hypothetical protein